MLILSTAAWARVLEDSSAAYLSGDYSLALTKLKAAAAQGDVNAYYNLGTMYSEGKGVAHDDKEASKWFSLAAAQGDAGAQFNLGNMYRIGEGVNQNYTTAAEWYRLAANQGHADAQNNLGMMYYYHYGHGAAENNTRAYMWLTIAAASGDKESITFRKKVAEDMTAMQITRAQKLARDCQVRKFKNCD